MADSVVLRGAELQRKARDIINELLEKQKQITRDGDDIAIAFGRVRDEIQGILLANLQVAIDSTEEYSNYPGYTNPLITAFSDPEMVQVTLNGEIYFLAEDIAGDINDFQDGVNAARQIFGLSKKGIRARARIWKYSIYLPFEAGLDDDDYESGKYEKTVDLRLSFWENAGKAPYWIWLENGTTSVYAYPKNTATGFLEISRLQGQALFERSLSSVQNQISDIINREILEFTNDPEAFDPFKIFDELEIEGKRYKVFVTRTKKLGVAQRIR